MTTSFEPPLKGRVAVVTGASYGIGYATAERLAQDGATVIITDITDRVDEAAGKLRQAGLPVSALRLNIATAAGVDPAVEEAAARHGRIDIFVCNAAAPRSSLSILEMTEADWDSHMEINVRGTMFCLRAAARAMIAQNQGGRMVTLASMAAFRPYQRRSHYSASKAAIIALTRVAALEFAVHGITVNCVAPGSTDTENRRMMAGGGLDEKEGEEMRARAARIPLGMVRPEDIAGGIAYFARPDSGHVTGQTLLVDGGAQLI